jgi:hypothetical protein
VSVQLLVKQYCAFHHQQQPSEKKELVPGHRRDAGPRKTGQGQPLRRDSRCASRPRVRLKISFLWVVPKNAATVFNTHRTHAIFLPFPRLASEVPSNSDEDVSIISPTVQCIQRQQAMRLGSSSRHSEVQLVSTFAATAEGEADIAWMRSQAIIGVSHCVCKLRAQMGVVRRNAPRVPQSACFLWSDTASNFGRGACVCVCVCVLGDYCAPNPLCASKEFVARKPACVQLTCHVWQASSRPQDAIKANRASAPRHLRLSQHTILFSHTCNNGILFYISLSRGTKETKPAECACVACMMQHPDSRCQFRRFF